MGKIKEMKSMSAAEVASVIEHDEVIGCSGFTLAGYPKAIPLAIAERGEAEHAAGRPYQLTLYTGASVGDELDARWARARITKMRVPFQSCAELRNQINAGDVGFMDFHLSAVPQYVRTGYLARPTTAIIEAVDVTEDGKIYLSMSGGASAGYALAADRIFIELNSYVGESLKGFHDVYVPSEFGSGRHIPLYDPSDRVGTPFVQVNPDKIAGIVHTHLPDQTTSFRSPDEVCIQIASHILDFLKTEIATGRLPKTAPYQSGVGNIANAVLACIAKDPAFPPISLFTEVVQDSVFELLENEKLVIASTAALSFSAAGVAKFLKNIDAYRRKFVLRQQDISNSPELICRLGVVAMNTALEMDVFGNVNSTHILGSKLMNGIGGSADFTRNSGLSFFMTPSTSKSGKISHVVPMVSHVDQSEHSTQIFVTEQGLADLRGLRPLDKAREIINKCAHPDYRPYLREQVERGARLNHGHHIPVDLEKAFELHLNLRDRGNMLAFQG